MTEAQQVQVVENDNLPQKREAEAANVLNVIERAALNPDINVEKLEKLLDMQDRVMANQARIAFDEAFAAMQEEMPEIDKRGKIIIMDKNNKEQVIQSTPFALWDDINKHIKPILAKHGFGLRFTTGLHESGKLTVTAILSHKRGHREETTMALPHDSTGSKNAVQAIGSSTTYGKRYAACALLNITTRGEDDDGAEAGGPEKITEAQAERLRKLIEETGSDLIKFCQWAKIDALPSLPQERFDTAIKMLQSKPKKGAANA